MQKRVLITGGTGFIGAHVCEHLLKETDWEVVVLDSISYAGDVARLTDLEGYDRSRISLHWHDLRSPIHGCLKNRIGYVDYILNVASESAVEKSIADPVNFVHNNVMLMLNMLEYARECPVSKFVHISTDEVFGPAPDDYFFKEWDRHMPSNPYAASKAAQENIAIAYWRTYNLPIIITSTMNNFGERQFPEKLVPVTIKHLLAGTPTPIYAEKTPQGWMPGSRVWLHARNHADALLYILNNVEPVHFSDIADRPEKFNIAGDKELDNLEVLMRVANILGIEKPRYELVDFHKARPGHDRRYALDGARLWQHGWKPPFDLDESFKRTVEWYQKNAKDWL